MRPGGRFRESQSRWYTQPVCKPAIDKLTLISVRTFQCATPEALHPLCTFQAATSKALNSVQYGLLVETRHLTYVLTEAPFLQVLPRRLR